MPSIDDLQLFTDVVRYKGISSAARERKLHRSKVSRRIHELERKLGYQLLIRTTHDIELTKQGRWLYSQVAKPLASIETTITQLEEQNREPIGTLRMAIPPVLGVTEFFTHVIERYTSLYPKVRVVVEHHSQAVDLERTNTDIQMLPAYAPPLSDDCVQQHFLELPCCMVASRDYLERNGHPKSMEELTSHFLLGSRYCKMWLPNQTDFYVYSEDLHLLRNLARDGKGITILPTVMLRKGIEEGLFIPLLTSHSFQDLKVTLTYASLPYLSLKSRLMVDLLRESIREDGVISYPDRF
jgi:DNA-binding transcriptional LysR family regulator